MLHDKTSFLTLTPPLLKNGSRAPGKTTHFLTTHTSNASDYTVYKDGRTAVSGSSAAFDSSAAAITNCHSATVASAVLRPDDCHRNLH